MRRAARALHQHVRIAYEASSRAVAVRSVLPSTTRAFAAGLKDVDPKTLSKARRLALFVGTAAGGFGSLVGVGGGVLIVPAIVNSCPSIPQRVISGTSLAAVVATGATAGFVMASSGLVDVTSALVIASGAVITAPIGARMTSRLNCEALRKALGWWLIGVAPLVPLKAFLFASKAGDSDAHLTSDQPCSRADLGPRVHAQEAAAAASDSAAAAASTNEAPWVERAGALLRPLGPTDALIAAVGCVAGAASGLLGIGGGTIVTPMLAVLTGMPQAKILGTSLAAMVLPSLVGLGQHHRMGNVDWRMGAMLAAGTACGSYAGSNVALVAPPGSLEVLFALGMAFLGRKMLASAAKAAAGQRAAATLKSQSAAKAAAQHASK